MQPVSASTLQQFLQSHESWQPEGDILIGGFSFESFSKVQKFVSHIMEIAEEMNHHPTVSFGYNFVRIETTTHDAGDKITDKDIQLASAISTQV